MLDDLDNDSVILATEEAEGLEIDGTPQPRRNSRKMSAATQEERR